MGEHAIVGNVHDGICASLPDQELMEALCEKLDELAIELGNTRKEVLGQLALDTLLGTGETRFANIEILAGRSTVLEMTQVALRYASAMDVGTSFRPLAEFASKFISGHFECTNTQITDEEIYEFERLALLALEDDNSGTRHAVICPCGYAVPFNFLPGIILERWDKDGDSKTAYSDLATLLRLAEFTDETAVDRALFTDACERSWAAHMEEVE